MKLKLLSSDFFYSPDFALKVIDRDPELPYPLHSHDFYELVIIVSGKGEHFTEGNSFSLFPGNVFVVTPGLEHGYKNVENLHLYNILFTNRIFIDSFPDLRNMPGYHALMTIEPNYRNDQMLDYFMQLTPAQMGKILPLIEQMQAECDSIESDDGSESLAMAMMIQLLVILFRIYAQQPRKDNYTILRMADAISFLESNIDRSVSIKELMELTNMSVSTLNRHFQAATGLSPVEYHIQLRIEQACRYIRTGDYSMGEISEATGFSDANYFSRQFRKVMGMSPREYKKNKIHWYT
ncbi:MAG: helix-turn-helix domain-containing protein [Sphaerochaetaceae bacterium]|nr:helix-turn-helix domain-containing protein [Sphaerochaetaceae bacterium]